MGTAVPIKKRGRPPAIKSDPVEKNNKTENTEIAAKVNDIEKDKKSEKQTITEKDNKVAAEKVNKVIIETEPEDENLDPFKNVKGRKGKIGRSVVKLLQDIEQLLVYQEKQSRLRNKTLMDLPEAVLLMKKYKKRKKKKKKTKTYLATSDKSAPLKISFKRQR